MPDKFNHKELDGEWTRVLPDGTLEMRDPNSGMGFDPETKPRFQYRAEIWGLLSRCLPPESAGDRWRDDDIDDPWWEPMRELPPDRGLLYAYWIAHGGDVRQHRYAPRHVIAYTPTRREVRMEGHAMVVQPHNDNYWITVPDLPAARRAYFDPHDWRRE